MEFTEIIGFIIVLFVFLLPLLRKLLIDKKQAERRKEPVEEVYIVEEEEVEAPLPPPVMRRPATTERLVKRDYAFETDFMEQEFQSKIDKRQFETRIAPKPQKRIVSEEFLLETKRKDSKRDPLASIVKGRNPNQAMVILSEILNRKVE